MSMNPADLCAESREFIKRYEQFLPDTVYYKDWKNRIIEPNVATLSFIEQLYANRDKDSLCIGEIGIGVGATSYHIAKFLDNKGAFHLFDYLESTVHIKRLLTMEGFTNIHAHGATFKKLDSYNWNLLGLLQKESAPIFDYVFLDGAHTFPVDGLAFFLVDLLLKPGGCIDFDDYHWTLSSHIAGSKEEYAKEDAADKDHGSFMQWSLEAFTPQQLNMKQVGLVVEFLAKRTGRYKELVPEKLYMKMA